MKSIATFKEMKNSSKYLDHLFKFLFEFCLCEINLSLEIIWEKSGK